MLCTCLLVLKEYGCHRKLTLDAVLLRSATLRKHVHFETEYCFACGMRGLDLRGPTSYVISLHGARQCNEHSLGQVPR
jgi:hypothetical protein